MEKTEPVSLDDASTSMANPQRVSKEGWYGTILLGVTIVVVVSVIGLAGWWGYTHIYKTVNENKVSITELPKDEPGMAMTQETSPSDDDSASETSSSSATETQATPNIKEEPITVLNGGGPGGSASKGADLLKKESFTKVSIGNTKKDYTGVTVYFASGKDDAALEVKKVLLKQYPKATSQEAPKTDPEASVSAIVVIIGK